MKKILLCSAALAIFAGQAMADGIYVAGKFGGSNGEANSIKTVQRYTTSPTLISTSESDFTNNVFSWGGAVGYEYDRWLVPLRMEVEYLYRNHYDYNSGVEAYSKSVVEFDSTIDTQTILANFYVDVPVTDMFGVFFGGGLGQALNTTNSKIVGSAITPNVVRGKEDNAAFSWMTTAGLTVKPLKWLAFDLSYRYADLGDISWRTGIAGGDQGALETDSFAAQEIYLGLRVMIPNMYKKPHHKKAHPQYMDK